MGIVAIFVDTAQPGFDISVKEGKIQENFLELLQKQSGWKLEKKFYKVAYNNRAIAPSSMDRLEATDRFNIYVAKHHIFSCAKLNVMLGMAIVGNMSPLFGDVQAKPTNSLDPTENSAFISYVKNYVESLEPSDSDPVPKMTRFFTSSTLYFYMLERLPEVEDDEYYILPWNTGTDALLRGCLDIEVWKAYWETYGTGDHRFVVREPALYVLQSPISECALRYPKPPLDSLWSDQFYVEQNHTNWWFDSDVHIQGIIADDGFFLMLQADTVPAWEDNIVPAVPLYFGKIDGVKGDVTDGSGAIAFFGGTVPDVNLASIPKFDFNDFKKTAYQKVLLPILKNYPRHPSNGVDTVMVHRGKAGARYQAYYLSWNTAPNQMPPDREDRHDSDFTVGIDRQYPRAWNQHEADEYAYSFNPSKYSDKLYTSKIYLIHPEEGIRGSLKYCLGVVPVGLSVGTKIRVLRDPCGAEGKPIYDKYRYLLVDGVSPVTKRPGTAYRPIGLGLLEEPGTEV